MGVLRRAQLYERRLTGNRFVDALPRTIADQIGRRANLLVNGENTALGDAGDRITEVGFPIGGAISHLEETVDGRSMEVLTVGRRGFSQFEILLGEPCAQYRRVTLLPVSAFVLDARAMLSMYERSPEMRALVGRYAVAAMRIAGLAGACARHDRIDARLAGWLLGVLDYAQSSALSITHERIATLLGVRRASISAAFSVLTAAGAVRVGRHHIEIVDAAVLESLACVCRNEARRLLDAIYEPLTDPAA